VFLATGILFMLCLASYNPRDPSWNTVTGAVRTSNLAGPVGAHFADLFLQSFGLAAFLLPLFLFVLGWKWIRSEALSAPAIKLTGAAALLLSFCGAAALLPEWRRFDHTILPGGTAGFLVADQLKHALNLAGAAVVLATSLVLSTYLVSSFTLAKLNGWLSPLFAVLERISNNWRGFVERRREAALEKRETQRLAAVAAEEARARARYEEETAGFAPLDTATTQRTRRRTPEPATESLPWDEPNEVAHIESDLIKATAAVPQSPDEIPICQLADEPAPAAAISSSSLSHSLRSAKHG